MPPETPAVAATETTAAPISFEQAMREAIAETETVEDAPAEAKSGEKQRGTDGKFKASEKKAEAAAEPEKVKAKDPETTEDVSKVPDSLARIRRLYAEGKVEEAFVAVFGSVPEKGLTGRQWEGFRKELAKERRLATADRAEAQQTWQKVQNATAHVEQKYARLSQAEKAFAAGDYEEGIRLMSGDDVNTFQKKLLGNFRNKDPKVDALEKRIAAMQAEREQERQQLDQLSKQQRQAELQQDYKRGIASELAETEDPRIAKVSKKQAFIEKVYQIEAQHYDRRSDSVTISRAEAAELAFDELYGDVLDSDDGGVSSTGKRDLGANPKRQPAGTVTPARQTAKAATSLRQSEAAEAAPDDMSQDEIFEFFVKKAKAENRSSA